MRIIFYLMNLKGLRVLESFLEIYDPENIEYIVLSKDNNVEKDYNIELQSICKSNSIRFYDRNDKIPESSNYKLAIGWRWIIDGKNIIVLHDSILPKYRGFAPLVNSLINKEKNIGVSAIFATQKYDHGDIILQKQVEIDYPIKIQEAIDKISNLYSQIIVEISSMIIKDKEIIGTPQIDKDATYSLWRDEEDYHFDFSLDSEYIKRKVDAVGFPYAGAKCFLNGRKIRLDEVEVVNDIIIINRDYGKVIFVEEGLPVVVCGSGLIRICKAIYCDDGTDVLPLKKFRCRFY